jgi:hypothetical protein
VNTGLVQARHASPATRRFGVLRLSPALAGWACGGGDFCYLAANKIAIVYAEGRGLMGSSRMLTQAGGSHRRFRNPYRVRQPRRTLDLRVVGSMHERKALMAELSDAFIACRRVRYLRGIAPAILT